MKKKLTTRDICFIGIFTAIIAICAQIRIPMPNGVPMTLQTFAIPLAGVVLGTKKGTLSTAIYILLGVVGAPVFTGFIGGFGSVFGATGGFILSFPIMALSAGMGARRDNTVELAVGLVIGALINYLCGMIIFAFVTSVDFKSAFASCVLPFIPTAIIKILLVNLFGIRIKRILGRLL